MRKHTLSFSSECRKLSKKYKYIENLSIIDIIKNVEKKRQKRGAKEWSDIQFNVSFI
jgi:hypothetical protein